MKNLKLISFLMILASSLMFIQCTSDPIDGKDGIAGIDGVDGVDGADGVGVQECVACHSDGHRDAIYDQYAMSNHATGSSWYYAGTRADCAQCHSNQGYIEFQETGEVKAGFKNPEPISCTGCHKEHRSFDFANDGNDYALRTLEPVTLVTDPTYAINSKNSSDLLGYSNTCVNCHQPREAAPTPDVNGNAKIGSHWGPHHGPQGTMLEGLGGALIAGTAGYPGVGTANHKKGSSCVTCHMGTPATAEDGGHTWNPSTTACVKCHTTVPTSVAGLDASRATLLALLQAKGVADANGNIIEGGTYPIKVVQAAWNYLYVKEDRSNGIHNPIYTKALIQNSIEAVQ
ncbi:MAG: hypothetical protein WC389_04790 [Lutibacter sp.]|jgi:hypothetical protein